MICQIEGVLEALEDDIARVKPNAEGGGGFTYQVMLPAFASARLSGRQGRSVTLHTIYYLDAAGQGNTFLPRLAGFLTPAERDFFEVLTTVKGIGRRKGLRAMAMAPAQIASAIMDRDVKFLQTLPEIGKRTAETIIVSLRGKIDHFACESAYQASVSGDGLEAAVDEADQSDNAPSAPGGRSAREVLDVLVQLGESRTEAIAWIDQILIQASEGEEVLDTETLLNRVFQLKASRSF